MEISGLTFIDDEFWEFLIKKPKEFILVVLVLASNVDSITAKKIVWIFQ